MPYRDLQFDEFNVNMSEAIASGGHLVADSDADPSRLRCRHAESRLRSRPEQYIHMGDEARHPRRSPRYDLTRLLRGETLEETAKRALSGDFAYSFAIATMRSSWP